MTPEEFAQTQTGILSELRALNKNLTRARGAIEFAGWVGVVLAALALGSLFSRS